MYMKDGCDANILNNKLRHNIYEQVLLIPNQSFKKDKAAEYLLWTIIWLRNVQSSRHHALILQKRKLVTLSIHRSNDKLNFWWITSNVYEFQVVFHNLHWYNLYAFIVVVYHSLFDIISIKRLGNNMIAKKLKFSLYLWILFDDLMFQLKWMSIFTVTAFSAKF